MWLVQLAFVELAACACAAACAFAGLRRLDPDARVRSSGLAVSSLSGGVCAGASFAFAGTSPSLSCAGPAALAGFMLLCPFLAVAAYADFVSGWAPEELSVPTCIFLGAVSEPGFSVAGAADAAAAVVTGLIIFCACRLAWRIQRRAGAAAMPPADCLAILAPVALFGLGAVAAAHYAVVALILAAIRLLPPVRQAFASEDAGSGRAVRFLPASLPVTLTLLVASFPLEQSARGMFG